MHKLDLVSIMSVTPGFGGQSFIPEALNKIRAARQCIDQHQQETGREVYLEVDGGIKIENIRSVADAGADTFVAGSAIFCKGDYRETITKMRAQLTGP